MNVMILQVKGRKAVALGDDGGIFAIPAQRGMRPGCSFLYEKQASRPVRRAFPAVAASFAAAAAGVVLWLSFSVSTYVDVNINPGVRMSLNAFGGVVSVDALNGDGQRLLSGIRTNLFINPENELALIIDRAVSDGYLKDSGRILITVSDGLPARAAAREKSLFIASMEYLDSNQVGAEVTMQKMSREALEDLSCQEPAQSAPAGQRYMDKKWHKPANPIYIDRAEALGDSRIRVVFSRDVELTGIEKYTLKDRQGNEYNMLSVVGSGDEWTLAFDDLPGGRGYFLTIAGIDGAAQATASLMVPRTHGGDDGKNEKDEGKSEDKRDFGNDRQHTAGPSSTADAREPGVSNEQGDNQDEAAGADRPEDTKAARPSPRYSHPSPSPAPESTHGEGDYDDDRDNGEHD